MGTTFARALGHVEKKAYAKALDVLIEAWRKQNRAPEIAAAIDAIDSIEKGGAGIEIVVGKWSATAKKADVVTRGALIRAIASMTMAEMTKSLKVVEKWDDPRVGTLLITMLEELRFSGRRSHNFWRDEVFVRMARLGDPRFLSLGETLPKKWNVGMREWLIHRLGETTAEIEAVKALSKAEQSELAKIVAAASELKKQPTGRATTGSSTSAKSGEALLAAIYANPTDDAVRAVYADWLIERNDPRGEFIALQLRPEADKDRAAKKREKDLLAKHKKEWLGKIGRMIGSGAYGIYPLEFQRGFVAKGALKFRNQKDVEEFGELAEWSTVEDLYWGDHEVDDDDLEWAKWIGPAFAHLKTARQPMAKHLLSDKAKAKANTSYAIEVLELDPDLCTEDEYRQLLVSSNLPKLRRVSYFGVTKPSALKGVKRCPPELCFSGGLDDDDLAARIKAAEATEANALIFDEYGGLEHRLTRDKAGKLTRLEIEMRPPSKSKTLTPEPRILTDLVTTLRTLKIKLTHFHATIEIAGHLVPAEAAIKAAKKLLR